MGAVVVSADAARWATAPLRTGSPIDDARAAAVARRIEHLLSRDERPADTKRHLFAEIKG